MKQEIQNRLSQIEVEYNIKILYACESGSRAWEFPSPDSDWDVRFIYIHNVEWYLSVDEKHDCIDLPVDALELDFSGWELKKALKLFRKSNVALLEWLESPIVYLKDEAFYQSMQEMLPLAFSSKRALYHFNSMSNSYFERIKDKEEVRIKDLFYALRAALACEWIMQFDHKPPTSFVQLLNRIDITESIKGSIFERIAYKAEKGEQYLVEFPVEWRRLIADILNRVEQKANELSVNSLKVESVNALMFKMIMQ